jgi:formyltetrahydrofolate deformylase
MDCVAPSLAAAMSTPAQYVLTLAGVEDDHGDLAHTVASAAVDAHARITDQRLTRDWQTARVFMRSEMVTTTPMRDLHAIFAATARRHLVTQWKLRPLEHRPKLLVMASRAEHCLADLLSRHHDGSLGGTIEAVVANHSDHDKLVSSYSLPYIHIDRWKTNKAEAEQELLRLVKAFDIDLVVLARFMQVLSDEVCAALPFRIINVHHALLPSFIGARAYHQAFVRGTAIVGATAHYVTADIDAGPIIEQVAVKAPRNANGPTALVQAGRDAEVLALATAVRLHCQDRVLPNGNLRPAVFD